MNVEDASSEPIGDEGRAKTAPVDQGASAANAASSPSSDPVVSDGAPHLSVADTVPPAGPIDPEAVADQLSARVIAYPMFGQMLEDAQAELSNLLDLEPVEDRDLRLSAFLLGSDFDGVVGYSVDASTSGFNTERNLG